VNAEKRGVTIVDITVYSKSGCAQCVFTKKFLESQKIAFNEKKIDENERYLEEVTKLGFHSLPVVTVNQEESFSGYDPNRLQNLVTKWHR